MKTKTAISIPFIVLVLTATFTMIPIVNADWPYEFEQYGPHVDRILITLYSTESAEFAAFEAGEIDLIDSPLTKYWVDRWTGNPKINMMDYGGDLGTFQIDVNNNWTKPQSGPIGPIPGAVEPNIGRNQAFRHAIAHLVDRDYVIEEIMQGFAVPIYTMVPPSMGGWMNMAVDVHPYNPTVAAAILDAAGIVDSDSDGYRNWPASEGVPGNPNVEIDFVIRDDNSPGSREVGDRLLWELSINLPGPKFKVDRWSAWGSVGARRWVMAGKSFTLYTGGWMLGRDPDYLFRLYHSSMYWNPGSPPNYANVRDPELDGYLEGIYFALTYADAMANTQSAQEVMARAYKNFVVPLYAASAPKAGRTGYTGETDEKPVSPDDGENLYRGLAWKGFVNEYGKGLDSWWTFLNAHPGGYELPNPGRQMTLRYGFKNPEFSMLNPVYSDSYWEWEILGKVYDSLLKVNPYDPSEDLEWMADRWQVLVWDNAGSPATELVFDLRNDIYFHDGVQLTAEDIDFTFVQLAQACDTRELPYPWYYSNLLDVNSVIIESPFKVRVRMNSLSYFARALHLVGGNIVLPKHVWGPLFMGPDMEIGTPDDETYDPETFAPDPQLIGSGPFEVYPNSIDKTDYYIPYSYVLLRSNRNYFRYTPDLKTGGATQVCWNQPGYLSVWKLNFHLAQVSSEEYVVIGDGLGNWMWWNDTMQAWANGQSPTLPPNPPGGVAPEVDLKPPATTTKPGVFNGNKPGILIKKLPVPVGIFPTLVQNVVVLERDTTVDTGSVYPWKRYAIVKPRPATEIEGDINDDLRVDIVDAVILSVQFGLRAWVWSEVDVNEDNVINVLDALVVIRDWSY